MTVHGGVVRTCDGRQCTQTRMRPGQPAFHHLPPIEQQVPAVRDLLGVGCPLRRCARILRRGCCRHDFDARMAPEPGSQRGSGPVGEQVDNTVRLHINQEGAVGASFTPGPVIHAQHPGRSGRRQRGAVHQSQERVGTRRHGQGPQQPGAGFGPGRQTYRALGPRESARAPGTRGEQARQAFGERAARALRIVTAEATHVQLELNWASRGGQVGWPPDIGAVRRVAVFAAGGARCASTFGTHHEDGSRGLTPHDSLHPAIGNGIQLVHRGLYASLSLPAVTPCLPAREPHQGRAGSSASST